MGVQANDVVLSNRAHHMEAARGDQTTVVSPPGCREEWVPAMDGIIIVLLWGSFSVEA